MANRRFAKVDLSLARRMDQREEYLLVRLPPGTDRILDDCLPSPVSVLRLSRSKIRFAVCRCFFGAFWSATRISWMIGNTGANTGRGRTSFCRYPGGSECDRIFFNVCQPSWYFSQAARWLRPFTKTCWRISFQFSMSLRTSGHLDKAGEMGQMLHLPTSSNCTHVRCHFHPGFPPGIATIFDRA